MNISQKKYCNKCRALEHSCGTVKCDLGYMQKIEEYYGGARIIVKPAEPCPKPTKNTDYIEARKWYRK
jgi:hypothetical protein